MQGISSLLTSTGPSGKRNNPTRVMIGVSFLLSILWLLFVTTSIASGRAYVPNEILIKYKHPASGNERAAFARKHALKSLHYSRLSRIHHLRVPRDTNIGDMIDKLRKEDSVEYAEPNFRRTPLSVTPNDPGWPNQRDAMTKVGAPNVWSFARGSAGIKVGILDTGADYTHPDLAANMWTNSGEIPGNQLDDDHNGFIDDVKGWDFCYLYDIGDEACIEESSSPADTHGHGTHVAGIIGASGNNGTGVTGINWETTLLPIRFINPYGDVAAEVRAIDYAVARGARIINASFGECGDVTSPDPLEIGFSEAEYEAIKRAGDQGVLFVASAGNSCYTNGTFFYDNDGNVRGFPASYSIDTTIGNVYYPALSNIIAVAATDGNDELWQSSNYGATSVHLGAPGVDIYSTSKNGGYETNSGTSMAAAMVSGAAALLWSVKPLASSDYIKNMILNGVDPLPSLSGKTVKGGRLNILRSLRLMDLLPLSKGWNLVSLPKQPPNNGTMENVLSAVSDKVDIVWGYSNESKQWLKYRPDHGDSTLTRMEPGKGYWIFMSEAAALDMSGWTNLSTTTVSLSEGWNLVGYSGIDGQDPDTAMASISGNSAFAWSWDNGNWQVKTFGSSIQMSFASLTSFIRGKGYWVKVNPGASLNWTPP